MVTSLALVLLSPGQLFASPVSAEIQLVGSDRLVWLIERQRTDAPEMSLVIAYRWMKLPGTQRFYPLMPAGTLSGRILRTVMRGDSLHAFYRDGSHWRYTPLSRVSLGVRPQVDHVELSLPNATVPKELTTDPKSQVMFAIVPARIANILTAKQRADSDRSTDDETDSPKDDTDSSKRVAVQSLPQDFTTDLAIVRYEGRQWVADREAPSDLALEVSNVSMLSVDGVVHLVYELTESGGSHRLVHRVSQASDKAWSQPMVIPVDGELSTLALGWDNDKPMLAIAYEASDGLVVRLARLDGQSWTMQEPLVDDAGEQVHLSGRLALAFAGEKLAIATLADDGDVQFGVWPIVTGEVLLPMAAVTSQIRPAPPAVPPSVQVLLQYAVLGGVLAVLFFWRREHVVMVPVLKPNEITAPHLRRLFALMIDIAVTLPAWLPVMIYLWKIDGLSFEDYSQMGQPSQGSAIGWYGLPTMGLVLGVYASLFEGFRHATLGKQAMGLSVKMHNGQACTWSAAIGRNAARIIEFAFPPLVLLVVMTPSKLRLGDMFARTLVVQRLEFPPGHIEHGQESDSNHSDLV